MRLDGFGLFVDDMAKMIRFYKDVLGFEIKEEENTSNVYLVKDGTLFLLYGRNDFEKMTNRRYEYIKGLNGHSEIALYVDTFEEVDEAYKKAVENGIIKWMFCGHDHLNTLSLTYKGIRLTYGMSIDCLGYNGISKSYIQRGGTLITRKTDGRVDIKMIPLTRTVSTRVRGESKNQQY